MFILLILSGFYEWSKKYLDRMNRMDMIKGGVEHPTIGGPIIN